MIRLGTRIQWFANDFTSKTLENLAQLGVSLSLQQDHELLHSSLSLTELGRLQRAFCRFETYRHLFSPDLLIEPFGETILSANEQAHAFLEEFDAEEVEEIACVRDYIVRRLWHIFDMMEDKFVAGEPPKLDQHAEPYYEHWYSERGKYAHDNHVERLMSHGLDFLREVFTADIEHSTALILSNRLDIGAYLSKALQIRLRMDKESIKALSIRMKSTPLKFLGDDLLESSIGWLWGHDWKPKLVSAEPQLKGLRDWGYVFWDKRRIDASGVLDRWSYEVKPYRFGDWYRTEEPSAMDRLKNTQTLRMYNSFQKKPQHDIW
ncbi:MAG: hypothetical protein Q9191_005018 [Dirinaria sp. TL-2023a]